MPPALIQAGIVAAGTIGSALLSSSASKKAAAAEAEAAEAAITEQARQYDTTRADLSPWRQQGEQALNQYAGLVSGQDSEALYEGLRNYPGYQFAMEEGLGAVQQYGAGRGTFQSGQSQKDLMAYGQGLASNNFENYMNRLQGLAGMGQNAAVQTGTFGAQKANQIGAASLASGQAQASGYQNQASIWGGAMEGVVGLAGNYIGGRNNSGYGNATPVADYNNPSMFGGG